MSGDAGGTGEDAEKDWTEIQGRTGQRRGEELGGDLATRALRSGEEIWRLKYFRCVAICVVPIQKFRDLMCRSDRGKYVK